MCKFYLQFTIFHPIQEKALSERASEILRAKGMARNLFDKEEEYQPPPVKRSALELSQQETIEELKSQLDRLTNGEPAYSCLLNLAIG